MRVVIKTYTKFYNIIEQYNLVLIAGLVGEPFNIETSSQFDTATITFKIDQSKLGDTEFDNLMFLWYDEENNEFIELETVLDEQNSTVSVVTTHFSKYMIVDR